MNHRYPAHSLPGIGSQKGIVLVMALIILMAMTIISVTSMTNSSLEESMASNLKDRELAFQAAEAALRFGETEVENGIPTSSFNTACSNGYCLYDMQGAVTYPVYWTDTTLDVWNDTTKHRTYSVKFTEVAEKPKFIIEYMGVQIQNFSMGPQATDPRVYRITALGTGLTMNSHVMLQSTYVKD